MRTVRRLFNADIASAVAFVAIGFLALFFFIDFVDELGHLDERGYTVLYAAIYALLSAPGHLYELMPIAVLIGAIYALARLAQTTQYTILRTGGLGPGRALWLLARLALVFGVITFLVGDYVSPTSEQWASELRSAFSGGVRVASSGAWIKERVPGPAGERSWSINVGAARDGSALDDVRIFEFDADGRLVARMSAAHAQVSRDGTWKLRDVERTRWNEGAAKPSVDEEKLPTFDWQTTLAPDVVAAAVLPLATMSTFGLWRYIGHLAENEQAFELEKIQFWKRALYPFACVVMMGLALPFAYLSARSGSVSLKVFIGILVGVSFVLLNNVFRHLGLLGHWTPWIVAATPGAIYLLLSLAAFSWLVRFR